MLPPSGGQGRGRPETANLHIHREPHPDQSTVGAGGIAFLLHRVPVCVLQTQVEGLLVVPRVVDSPHLGGVRELVRLDEVLATHLGGVHAQLGRQDVHTPLDKVGRLRTTRATIRIRRRLVGEHFGQGGADGGNIVGRVRHHHRQRRDGGREQHVVRADVSDEAKLHPQHLAVTGGGQVDVADDVAAVGGGEERL